MLRSLHVLALAASLSAVIGTKARAVAWDTDATSAALPYDLAFAMKRLPSEDRPALSPDGQSLAYSVRTLPPWSQGGDPPVHFHYLPNGTPRRMVGTQLYVTEVGTGETRSAGPASGSSWKPSWSPDSRLVAFFSDAGGMPQLWVYDVRKGVARKVSELPLNPSIFPGDEACWSPDGTELYVRLRPSREAEPQPKAGEAKPHASDGPTVTVYRSGEEERRQKAIEPSRDGTTALDAKESATLAAIHVRSGAVRTLVPAEATPRPGWLRLSASGKWISYLSVLRQKHPVLFEGACDLAITPSAGGPVQVLAADLPVDADDYLGTYRWHPFQDLLVYLKGRRLWLVDLRQGGAPTPRQLATELGNLLPDPLLFSRDGRYVVVRPVDHHAGPGPQPPTLALVPIDGGKPQTIPLHVKGEFLGVVRANPQTLWQPRPGFVTTGFSDPDTGEQVIVRINVESGENVTLRKERARSRFIGSGIEHHSIVVLFQSADTPPDVYQFSDDFSQQRRLTHVEPRLDGIRVGPVISYETSVPQYDGKMIQVKSALLLPPGARRGDKLPTIVFIYGGSMLSPAATEFGGGIQAAIPVLLFATRGYAVMLPDVPIGPEGAGRNPVREMTDVLLPQVYRAAELGYTDIQRVALIGHSYGGYGVAAVLSQTNLFRAGVAISGIYDLPGLYARMREGDSPDFVAGLEGQGRMGTHPWANLTRYIANSPYYQVDKISTPLLLIHGEHDGPAPQEEAKKMYNALKRLGKTAQLATYAGEGHVLYEWSLVNAVDASRRIVEFLDRHVGRSGTQH
jgi:dipeptidyl aminopeptidase/acylaminoacyl peptidase